MAVQKRVCKHLTAAQKEAIQIKVLLANLEERDKTAVVKKEEIDSEGSPMAKHASSTTLDISPPPPILKRESNPNPDDVGFGWWKAFFNSGRNPKTGKNRPKKEMALGLTWETMAQKWHPKNEKWPRIPFYAIFGPFFLPFAAEAEGHCLHCSATSFPIFGDFGPFSILCQAAWLAIIEVNREETRCLQGSMASTYGWGRCGRASSPQLRWAKTRVLKTDTRVSKRGRLKRHTSSLRDFQEALVKRQQPQNLTQNLTQNLPQLCRFVACHFTVVAFRGRCAILQKSSFHGC